MTPHSLINTIVMKTKNPVLLIFCSILLCFPVCTMAKVRAHIIVRTADGVAPTELVISKDGVNSDDSPYRTGLENGSYEVDIETDHIDSYGIFDLAQLKADNTTSRIARFLIEDGAVVTLTLYDDRIEAVSTGPEQLAKEKMERLKMDRFRAKAEEMEKIDDAKVAEEMYGRLMEEVNQWERDYYSGNPMISFLLDLDTSLKEHRFEDHDLINKLQLYHDRYAGLYPGHPAHRSIEKNENAGFQIYGGTYHDFDVRTLDGEKVRAYHFIKPGYNLVICWATWCGPCRRECKDIAEFIGPYLEKGLNAFAIAREFKNTENLRKAVDNDRYPWPTLVDLDDEFHVFDLHGATSSAIFLINPEGKIIYTGLGPESIKSALDTLFTPTPESTN